MAWAKQQMIQIGDWVSGTSLMDERFIGYVESMNGNGKVMVYVTQSDHDEAVGEWIEGALAKLEKLDDYVPSEIADLQSLMDLALITRDQDWFNELAAALRIAREKAAQVSANKGKTYGNGNWNRRVKID